METITSNPENIESAIRTILAYIGEDPEREGLKGTTDRIIRMWKEIFRGYNQSQKPKITTFSYSFASNGSRGEFIILIASSGVNTL